ncbi:endothelial differentiation-related factor 1-like [Sycon ciliatum]|uniref:endothelial differentiation-related factor 1-like n=1 Tax=Sycon ciliatum TaxID=27933 RepID=UPI0020A8EED6|eukprot:scpid89262/ scgid32360/ Endothelial differentiation-related factor 1; Calmodulin-associated peptide 19; Multiprotein-bridging factor 1; Endothelial differentiation-related factor 1; Multiprotein-bridging factor 1
MATGGGEDWDTVTYLRAKPKTGQAARSQQAVNSAQRHGLDVDTQKKYAAGTNKQQGKGADTSKLDRETEELHHDRVSMSVGRAIQKGRQDKSMTQKELSTKINEKPQVVNEYESGKAIPQNTVLAKMERALGIKLRGKDIGQPLTFGPKKK